MPSYNDCYSIGTLAKKANIPISTIHYYVQLGLITPAITKNTYRYFNNSALETIRRIRFLSEERLTLSEIRDKINRERGLANE